jgi:hypothetical protein
MSSDYAHDYDCPVSFSKCYGCCKVIDIYIYIDCMYSKRR